MYSLPRSGMLSHNNLISFLKTADLQQSTFTPGLWLHKTRLIQFPLLLTTLGQNILSGWMPSSSFKSSMIPMMKPLKPGQKLYSVASPWNGITINNNVSCWCQVTLPLSSFASIMNHTDTKNPQKSIQLPFLVKKYKLQSSSILPNDSIELTSSASNKSFFLSFTNF